MRIGIALITLVLVISMAEARRAHLSHSSHLQENSDLNQLLEKAKSLPGA
jgi:hypothetical protein